MGDAKLWTMGFSKNGIYEILLPWPHSRQSCQKISQLYDLKTEMKVIGAVPAFSSYFHFCAIMF